MTKTDVLSRLPEKVKKVKVKAGNYHAGNLSHTGHYSFNYVDDEHLVSLTMPYKNETYNYGALHPVFTQSLPEGYLRKYISEKLRRYADVDDLYLLALMGDKGIGHLSYDSAIKLPPPEPIDVDDILHWDGNDKLFPQLLETYYLGGMAAGVQPKVVVSRSTLLQKDLIVKTYDEEFPLLTVNEFICMKCAEFCGLDTPKVWLSDNLEHYIVERFDINQQGVKIGIEDLATLMGKTGDQKYLGSYENVLKAISLNTHSIVEVEKAFELIAFNCLIGNGDAHLKNFSLQYNPDFTSIKLSPVYDVTHTLIYPTLDKNMALKLKGSKSFPVKKDLVELAFSAGITRSSASNKIDALAQNINECLVALPEVDAMGGLRESILINVDKVMTKTAVSAPYRHQKKKKYE